MSTRTSFTTLLLLLAWLIPRLPAAEYSGSDATSDLLAPEPREPSGITVEGADRATEEVIEAAVERFGDAGLNLPALRICVHSSKEPCYGHMGLYGKGSDKHRIDLCEIYPEVVLHELAHAWEFHSLDDRARDRFLVDVDLEAWADKDTPHRSRGIERMAYLVAWGLYEQPIQRILLGHHGDDLALFEKVTGVPSPRIAHLVEAPDDRRRGSEPRHFTQMARSVASPVSADDKNYRQNRTRHVQRSVVS